MLLNIFMISWHFVVEFNKCIYFFKLKGRENALVSKPTLYFDVTYIMCLLPFDNQFWFIIQKQTGDNLPNLTHIRVNGSDKGKNGCSWRDSCWIITPPFNSSKLLEVTEINSFLQTGTSKKKCCKKKKNIQFSHF